MNLIEHYRVTLDELTDRPGAPDLESAIAQEASCFVAGTLVLTADGEQRPIESLRPGDRVVGRRGRLNRGSGPAPRRGRPARCADAPSSR